MKARLLLLLIAGVSGVYCSHSLQFYNTVVSIGMPEYISVGFVDWIQISKYSSDIGRAVIVAPWAKKLEPIYGEIITQIEKVAETAFKKEMKTITQLNNQTGEYHSAQQMYGCELRDDGSTKGYSQFGYDGKDFLVLDIERGVYIPLTDQAQIIAQRVNSADEKLGERHKLDLENLCITGLKACIQFGKEELDRRVRPAVKVSDQKADGATKLLCQVYGFYPRDVDVNWKRDGIEVPSDEAKQVLPNTDGTYQITVTVEVLPEEMNRHSCHVEHISLDKTVIVKWEPKSTPVSGIAIGGFVVLGVFGAGAGFGIWQYCSGQNRNFPSTL